MDIVALRRELTERRPERAQTFLIDHLAGVAHYQCARRQPQLAPRLGTQCRIRTEGVGVHRKGHDPEVSPVLLGAQRLGHGYAAGEYRVGMLEGVALEKAEGPRVA